MTHVQTLCEHFGRVTKVKPFLAGFKECAVVQCNDDDDDDVCFIALYIDVVEEFELFVCLSTAFEF